MVKRNELVEKRKELEEEKIIELQVTPVEIRFYSKFLYQTEVKVAEEAITIETQRREIEEKEKNQVIFYFPAKILIYY